MRRYRLLSVRILVLIFGLFVVSGCSTIYEKTVHGSNYVLDKGVLEITLEENPSTGFSWQYTIDKSGIIKFIEDKYIDKNSNGKLGSPGVHKWIVKGVGAGDVKITFAYSKNNKIDKEIEYILTVDDNGKISNVECREIVLAKRQPDKVSEKEYTWGESALLKKGGMLSKLIDDELETTPYKIEYADDKTIFFRNNATLIKCESGEMQGIADLGKMNCSYMQGSIISETNFNSTNSFAVIGNNMYEKNNKDDYESDIYMLDTSNGKFFTIMKGNMLNMADSWSFNGRYYVIAERNINNNILFFDALEKKLYSIESPQIKVDSIFVSNNGNISIYGDSKIAVISNENADVIEKVEFDSLPVYINGDKKIAYYYDGNSLKKFDIEKEESFQAVDVKGDTSGTVIKNERYLLFLFNKSSIGIIDLATEEFNIIDNASALPETQIASCSISPEGDAVMFSNDNDYKIINKHGFFGVKKNNNSISNAKLDSEKTIVFIRTINNENQETQLSKNSSFEIVQYNIKENTEKIIYSSNL